MRRASFSWVFITTFVARWEIIVDRMKVEIMRIRKLV